MASRKLLIKPSTPSTSVNFSLPHIPPPLTDHPRQTTRTNQRRPGQRTPPPRRPKVQPLTEEMPPGKHKRRDGHLIPRRLIDVVRCVQAYQRGHGSPGAEGAAVHGRYCREAVDTLSIVEGQVGLDAVAD